MTASVQMNVIKLHISYQKKMMKAVIKKEGEFNEIKVLLQANLFQYLICD
jgi:hypothetical protein